MFTELHLDLVAEWKPVGRTEEDAVLSIAKGMWRKRRMQIFLSSELEKHSCDPGHFAYNEAEVLRVMYRVIEAAPDKFEIYLCGLRTQPADELRRKFPRKNFQSDSDWVKAVQHEIVSTLLPAATLFGEADLPAHSASVLFTDEAIEHDIGIEERIDAMIDRAIKRLVQVKAMKQMLGSSTIENRDQLNQKSAQTVSIMDRCRGIAHACTADGQHSRDR